MWYAFLKICLIYKEKILDKYIDNYEEIKRSIIKTFETVIEDFDFETHLFDKQADVLKALEEEWKNFLQSDDYYCEGELNYQFSQIRNEILKFLEDLPDFSQDFISYFNYRNIFLKMHAPHL